MALRWKRTWDWSRRRIYIYIASCSVPEYHLHLLLIYGVRIYITLNVDIVFGIFKGNELVYALSFIDVKVGRVSLSGRLI